MTAVLGIHTRPHMVHVWQLPDTVLIPILPTCLAQPCTDRQVVGIATHVGVGVHFNPLVQIDGKVSDLECCPADVASMACLWWVPTVVAVACQMVKYGVLSTADLMDDLASWRRLYVGGWV